MLVIGLVGVVLSVTVGALVLAAAVRTTHTARSGADLAALAGALVLRDGGAPESACDRAAYIAAANNAMLEACTITGSDVTVAVSVPVEVAVPLVAWRGAATARAKAGPQLRSR